MNQDMEIQTKEQSFLELWEMGMKFFNEGNPQWQVRYCMKNQRGLPFNQLKKQQCWNCKEFIENNGICDPI